MNSEVLSGTSEDAAGNTAKLEFGDYGYIVRDGWCSRDKGGWNSKDFEVGVSVCGKQIKFCWHGDEEDGQSRMRQIYMPADAVRAILNQGSDSCKETA